MSELGWPDYVGMISGAIGAITGIAGAIMGYISYQKTNSMKTLDLRLELRRTATQLLADLAQLKDLIDYADKSRTAVAAATGMLHSGQMVIGNQGIAADKKKVMELDATAPKAKDEYQALTERELESKLVDVHRLQISAIELINKYEAEVAKDDEGRRHIKETAERRH